MSFKYERINPFSTYAPWREDELFLKIFKEIKEHTMVDMYRCWELWSLSGQSSKFPGSCIEIGVWNGGTGAIIAKQVNPATVYLCDTFKGVVKVGERDSHYENGWHSDSSIKKVNSLINKLKLKNIKILQGIFPEETGDLIPPDTKFKFVHIDVDVYQSAKDIIEWIWDKITVGGMVVYDDYGFDLCDGITTYVNEQLLHTNKLILHNLNGHAVVVKIR